jgi:hypothetical protein
LVRVKIALAYYPQIAKIPLHNKEFFMTKDNDVDTIISIDSPVAAVRMLDTAAPNLNDWVSPEFVSLAGTVAVNLVTAAAVVGWMDASQAQELTKALTTIITAVSALSVNGLIVWKYIAGKHDVQVQKIQAQMRYAEFVAREQIIARAAKAQTPRRK